MGIQSQIDEVRAFNRFYTKQVGALQEGLLQSPFSLTEMRVLYELAHRDRPTATELCRELGLDPGYLSRILRQFERKNLVARHPSEVDGRQTHLDMTPEGREAYRGFDKLSDDEVRAMLGKLSETDQERLIEAMRRIRSILEETPPPKVPYVLRSHQAGDMGWVVYRHGILYAKECGYDDRFEALIAEIVAKFIQNFDPRRERCWIAEREGEIVGSVFLVKEAEDVAKLRLLLVEPSARGLGIGARLVNECVRFARQANYRRMILWTQSELGVARHIYQRHGFRRTHEERHSMFGPEEVAETWELDL